VSMLSTVELAFSSSFNSISGERSIMMIL
jgi:hypothetical protein